MVIAGFTGTQIGMTEAQKQCLHRLLRERQVTALHHGDCIGADAEAHAIALELGIEVVLHPPDIAAKRAFCKNARETRPEKPYLVRNHDIVDAAQLLFVLPNGFEEELRSGTWATYRYGCKQRREMIVILPDGEVRACV
jgi:hypothetical protein